MLAGTPSGFCLERALPIFMQWALVPVQEGESTQSSTSVELGALRLTRLAEVNDEQARKEVDEQLKQARSTLARLREAERAP